MTSLTGEFQTDLSLPDVMVACTDAIDGLGWYIESVEANRIVSYTDSDSDNPAKIEVSLEDSGEMTDVRISGSDSDAEPIEDEVLIAELNSVRDAIKASLDDITDSSESASKSSHPVPERASMEQAELDGETETRSPSGWYENPQGQGMRWWDGQRWTEHVSSGERSDSPMSRPEKEADSSSTPSYLLWGLSLAFGAVGGTAAVFGVPVISFYVPLGFGIAGAVLAIAAGSAPGKSPRWAVVAVIASVLGIAAGVDGYSQYQDVQDELDQAQQELDQLGSP